jgi:uncharacterized protein with beta-barrel porin domain
LIGERARGVCARLPFDAGFGELGYGFASGTVTFDPFANLAYVRSAIEGFAEKGGAAG